MAVRRILGMTALAVGVVAVWRMLPRPQATDGGTAEVPWPLGMGTNMNRWRQRIAVLVGGGGENGTLEDYEGADGRADSTTTDFDWAFSTTEAGAVMTALAMERIVTDSPTPASEDRDAVNVDKLLSAGIHLDEESRDNFTPVPRLHVLGKASPRHLARAIERSLTTENVGVIVDTSRGDAVEIDQHRDVGRGNVLLVDAAGTSRVLRHGTMRTLIDALVQSATGGRPADARAGAPASGAGERSEFSQLPPTIDALLRELAGPSTSGGPITVRLAQSLGALRHCRRCNTPIVEVAPVAQAIANHYGAPQRRDEIAAAIATSEIETGHPERPEFCHRHGSEPDLS